MLRGVSAEKSNSAQSCKQQASHPAVLFVLTPLSLPCQGVPYHGKPADMWALGVTLYVFVTGQYPFLAQSYALADLYQAILHEEPAIPADLPPPLQDLLRKLLEKDPGKRATAEEAARHPWLTAELGPLPQVELRGEHASREHFCVFSRGIISLDR